MPSDDEKQLGDERLRVYTINGFLVISLLFIAHLSTFDHLDFFVYWKNYLNKKMGAFRV